MVAERTAPAVEFDGTKKQKDLAERVFQVLHAKGMFSSEYAPIKSTFPALLEYLSSSDPVSEDSLREALAANAAVFALVTENDEEMVVTTRRGTVPVEMKPDTKHTFAARFMTPQPAPERPLRTEKPVPDVVINPEIANEITDTRDQIRHVEHDLHVIDGIARAGSLEDEGVRVELMSDEEVAELTAARERAEQERAEEEARKAAAEAAAEVPVAEETAAEAPSEPEPDVVDEAPETVSAEIEAEPSEPLPEEADVVVADEEEAVEAEPVLAEVVEEPEPEPVPQPAAEKVYTDLSAWSDDDVAAALTASLAPDPRFAQFGDHWMPEASVQRLSRGNLRRIADDINEQERPLTDDVLAQDVLGARRSSSDFAAVRFSLNYRLSSERGFEFLGTRDQPFWGTTELSPIGTTRRKANDIGTDYRYLVDEVPLGSVEPRTVSSVEHTLTFYEFTYGLLPLDERMQALLPAPMMQDQRAAVITVEIPQFENSIYLVEVRYPTQTRGGFILGLDDFYEEKLVPGAMVSIEATDNDGHYKIEYLEDDEQQDRFLELDDRRAPKYVFRPLTYDTAVATEWMVTEDRFPGFNSEKPLSEKRRRRIDDVIEATFERIGESEGTARITTFQDLLVAVNIERPASEAMLREAIERMSSVADDGTGILSHDTAS